MNNYVHKFIIFRFEAFYANEEAERSPNTIIPSVHRDNHRPLNQSICNEHDMSDIKRVSTIQNCTDSETSDLHVLQAVAAAEESQNCNSLNRTPIRDGVMMNKMKQCNKENETPISFRYSLTDIDPTSCNLRLNLHYFIL